MSRILKRPMFRRGGSSNQGIMTGLVDRKGYQEDGFVTTVGQRAAALTPELEALLRQYTPKTRLPIGEFGLNIASGKSITEALQDPYRRFTRADDAREAAIKGGAAKLAIGKALETDKVGTLKQVRNTSNQELFGIPPGKTGFASSKQIMSVPGAFSPIDQRMAFEFDTKSGTLTQRPVSDIDQEKEDKRKATATGTQYTILNNFVGDMKTRLPGTVTGVTGSIFGFVEGSADQFRQMAESLGVKEGLVIKDEGAIDKFLKDKGFTEKAASYGTMKGSVINLGYALAKIAEPDNPRLSEGDIIRQLNRINFGSSREVFSASLDQILKEEGIRARAEIKGLGFDNPDIFFNIGETGISTGTTKDTKSKGTGYEWNELGFPEHRLAPIE